MAQLLFKSEETVTLSPAFFFFSQVLQTIEASNFALPEVL
jgi:hypothetical protein